MDTLTLSAHAISEKARAERLYLHYAFILAALFVTIGAVLAVLALGNRLDLIVRGDGGLDDRLLNATPGFALCLTAALLIVVSRPRRMPQIPAATGADDLEQRIERAVSARMGAHHPANDRAAETGPPGSMLNHIARNLADALEQSALEALATLQQSRDIEPAKAATPKGGPVTADT